MGFSSVFFAVIPASWHSAPSSSSIRVVDVEDQIVSGTCVPYVLPAEPEQARVVPARDARPRTSHVTAAITSLTSSTTSADVNVMAMDDFLGGVSRRQDSAQPSNSSDPDSEILEVLPPPPPYVDTELPVYSLEPTDEEPDTLAKYMFKFGFLFPLFWILGAVILVFPLTLPRDLELSKSREERELCERIIRAAEVKWAKRCAWALFTLLVLIAFVGAVIAVVVMKLYP